MPPLLARGSGRPTRVAKLRSPGAPTTYSRRDPIHTRLVIRQVLLADPAPARSTCIGRSRNTPFIAIRNPQELVLARGGSPTGLVRSANSAPLLSSARSRQILGAESFGAPLTITGTVCASAVLGDRATSRTPRASLDRDGHESRRSPAPRRGVRLDSRAHLAPPGVVGRALQRRS